MVHNAHERQLPVPVEVAGRLIDTLALPVDQLWPSEQWPAMRLDRPLDVGARGGHGPIRLPRRGLRTRTVCPVEFEAPTGFDGYHAYAPAPAPDGRTSLRRTLFMRTIGAARLSWPPLEASAVRKMVTTCGEPQAQTKVS